MCHRSGTSWVIVLVVGVGCGRIGFDPAATDLELVPATATINLGSKVAFEVSGGAAPYTFELAGEGWLDGQTFIAPSRAGETAVRVHDTTGATADALVRYEGTRLFVIGGLVGGTTVTTVLESQDGATWAAVGDLPVPRSNGALVVFDDRMLYMGGANQADVPSQEIYASTDGVTWSLYAMLPVTDTAFTSVVHDGEVWFTSGNTGSGNNAQAYHSRDGVTWTPAGSINHARHEADLVSRGGRLYAFGGHGSGTTFYDDVESSADGQAWDDRTGLLTFTTDEGGAGELGDVVFRTCGSSCTTTETSTDLMTWTRAAPLPNARTSPALVGFGGRMLLVGGADVLATADGSSWAVAGQLPQPTQRTSAVQFTPH